MKLTAATDKQKIQQLAECMREGARNVLVEAQRLLDETDPGKYEVRVHSTWRSPEVQLARYMEGRARTRDGTIFVYDQKQVVTNAVPAASAHCIVASDGVTPASMALDLWILDREQGALLPNRHLAWSVIPFAAYRSPVDLVSGAFFRSIPGGDWPHLEHPLWQDRTTHGRLLV